MEKLKKPLKMGIALPTEQLIYQLNQKIVGWTNYYRIGVSSRIFSQIDSEIFLALKRWGLKRHARKSKAWIIRRYFTCVGNDQWRFYCTVKDKDGNKKKVYLRNASATKIQRHRKIIARATPFDPQFREYFQMREKERLAKKYNQRMKFSDWVDAEINLMKA